jgi:PadR family transcriptional regulator PadR
VPAEGGGVASADQLWELNALTADRPPRYHVVGCQGVCPIHLPREARMGDKTDLLQGSLDLLILKVLVLGPLHGWGISKRISQLSGDILDVGQGSLYPALYRLEDRGWIRSKWGTSPEGRRAKFYTLTAAGRRQFAAEEASWRLFAGAVEQILQAG